MPQASKQTIKVAGDQAGQRLDRVLAQTFKTQALANQAPPLSRNPLKALILDGAVSIGARTVREPGGKAPPASRSAAIRRAATAWRSAPTGASPSPIGRCWSASTARTAKRTANRRPA